MRLVRVIEALPIAILLACLAYGYYLYRSYGEIVSKEAAMGTDLKHLSYSLWDYREKHHCWPKTLEELGEPHLLRFTDCMHEEPFLYFPDATPGTNEILIAQASPFRTAPWPFGVLRKCARKANNESTIIEYRSR